MSQVHPVTKIILVLILSLVPYLLPSAWDVLGVFFLVLVLIGISKISLVKLRKFIGFFLLANISIFIAWLFFSVRPGTVTYFETEIVLVPGKWVWHILITDVTLRSAFTVVVRVLIMFFLMIFFFTTTSDRDLIHGLRTLKVPYAACLMASITFRGLSLFQEDYDKVKDAMKTRGVEFERAGIVQKIRNFINIFIALIVLMFKRTEDMASAIEARGITLRSKQRTTYLHIPFRAVDGVIMALLGGLLAGTIFLRVTDGALLPAIWAWIVGRWA